MKKRPTSSGNGFLGLFTTLLVVAGVIAVAYIAAPHDVKNPPKSDSTSGAPAGSTEPASAKPNPSVATSSVPPFLLMNGSGMQLITPSNTKTLKGSADLHGLTEALTDLRGVDVATGQSANVQDMAGFSTTTDARSPDGKRVATIATHKSDGTSTLNVKTADDQLKSFALRLKNGTGIRDVKLLGWWDAQTIAVYGVATTSRALYRVDLLGVVQPVSQPPDFIEQLKLIDGNAWYIEVTPGAGLEQADQAPTTLHRVTSAGVDSVVADEPAAVITSFSIHSTSLLAYQTDDSVAHLISQDRASTIGNGTPLVFLDDTHLVLRREQNLIVHNLATSTDEPLPPTASHDILFALPSSILTELQASQ